MSDPRCEAGQQLVKEAGWGLIARLGAKAIPYLVKYAPKALGFLGKRVGKHLANPTLWKTMGRGALSHARFGTYIGGGMGALGGALGAAPGESKLWGALKGGAGGAAYGGGIGALAGGVGGAARYGLAPSMYRGAIASQASKGGGKFRANLSPSQAREVAAAGGNFSYGGGAGGAAGKYRFKPGTAGGKMMSLLPGAAAMGAYSLDPSGGGATPGAAPGAANAAQGAARGIGSRPPFPPGAFNPYITAQRARRLPMFTRFVGGKAGNILIDFVKAGGTLPQFSPVPFSAHTAIADYIKNKKYKPEVNEYTRDDQRTMDRLESGMSRSSARTVGASRRARNVPKNLLKQHFQAAGLWA